MADDQGPDAPTGADLARTSLNTWAALLNAPLTAAQRACLDAARIQTDRLWVLVHDGSINPSGQDQATSHRQDRPTVRELPARDGHWCRLALAAYDLLLSKDAYAHLSQVGPRSCAAQRTAIQAWLRSRPDADGQPAGQDVTVADRLGVDTPRPDEPHAQVAWLSTVVVAAQDARVFGLDRYRVDVLAVPSADATGPARVRVVVDGPHGLALASTPRPVSDLLDPDTAGVDATVAALTRAADVVTALFAAQQAAVWHDPPPRPQPEQSTTGRGFPTLRAGPGPAPARPVTNAGRPERGSTRAGR